MNATINAIGGTGTGNALFDYSNSTSAFEGAIRNNYDNHSLNANNIIFAIYGNGTNWTKRCHTFGFRMVVLLEHQVCQEVL